MIPCFLTRYDVSIEDPMDNPALRRVVIDPVTRVEGHGKVTLLVDDNGIVQQARLHIVEFRGFEKFIQGRPYWELPLVVQRLCGICPVSHHLAAGKAIDRIAGVDTLSLPAIQLRRLMHFGQVLQSHALHFFHLASPDLLFGFASDTARRHIVEVAATHPDIALQGIRLRKFGQQVIQAISGKRIHGIAAIPGGMNKSLTAEDIRPLMADIPGIIALAESAVELTHRLYEADPEQHRRFGSLSIPNFSLAGPNGELELYDGGLRLRDPDGTTAFDHVPDHTYTDLLREEVRSWSYMKFPFLTARGPEHGWYRVGPLARINNCDRIPTPRAEAARQAFVAAHGHQPANGVLAFHWARMIEALHCAEAIADLLQDPALQDNDRVRKGERRPSGIGVIEAPRGTLIHHYEVDDNDIVTRANLIVSTTHNNQAMNESIRRVAREHLDGNTLTPALLSLVEVAIRAYDPCLSCATHALGQMPLRLELANRQGQLLASLERNADGEYLQGGDNDADG